MNKRFLNGSNSPTNNRAHVVNQKNECWAELAQFQSEQQQQEYNHSYHNSNHQSRRQQNKFQSIKNHSKPYNKTSSYSNNFNKINDEKQQRVLTEDFNYQNNKIFTPTVYEQQTDSSDSGNGVVPCMPLDQSPSDDSNFCPDSPEASVSSSQTSLENKENEDYSKNESNREENNMLNQSECNQNNYSACNSRCNHQQTQMIEIPQLCEINCNTSGIYNNGLYDYEYQAMNAHHLMQQQTPPQYYVYHPYSEYSAIPNVTGSPLLNTPITPQQQQHQQTPQYYTYQTIAPSYYYDPSGTYTPSNMASPFSTPQAQPPQQQILSSPQHQSTILASYQTPPPAQHQLYMTPASMSPPTSISPNQMLSNNSSATISNERLSNCNSPLQQHQLSNVLQNNSQQVNQTPTTNQNSFVMYTPGTNPYLTQQFQCQSPSQSYLMYHAPPQVNTIQSQGPMQPTQMQSPPMVYSSYQNSPMMSPQINNNGQNNNNNNNNNRFNKSRANRYNNNQFSNFHKRNFNQKFNNSNQFANMQQSNMIFSPLESIYLNNPILNTQPPGTYDDYLNDELTQKLVDPNVTVYSPPPPQIYCDINGNLIGMPNPEAGDYDSNGISSYGDEYDSYDENSNSDDNEENLACTVCRGRRMCFCYFLKVRYYKFPSFFDLVDHQYKKWRSTMAKAKKA